MIQHHLTVPLVRAEVEAVHARGDGNIRVHPNGFIQLDLLPVEDGWHASHKKGHSGAARRLHVWNPPGIELPHQGTVNEIHDHVFTMRSHVVRGMLFQLLYDFEEGQESPTHELYQAVYAKNSDSRLKPTGKRGCPLLRDHFGVREGWRYIQPPFTLHDTKTPGLCVTVMEKTVIHDGEAHVLCPIDQPPDNAFDRASAAPPELLWEAVDRSLAE